MGGAFYTLVSVPQFNREMTGGAGYIALAAVIFGKWDPIRATLAALLFGFATNLQGVLSVIGSPVPSQFMLMLPYVVTIFAVAGLVGRSRPPAADGIPYTQGLATSRSQESAATATPASTRAPMPDGSVVDAQVALVEVVRRPAGSAGAEPSHRTGHPVEVPPEVLAAEALLGGNVPIDAEHALDRVAEEHGRRPRRSPPAARRAGSRPARARRTAPRSARPAAGPASRPRPRRPRRASGRCRRPDRSPG